VIKPPIPFRPESNAGPCWSNSLPPFLNLWFQGFSSQHRGISIRSLPEGFVFSFVFFLSTATFFLSSYALLGCLTFVGPSRGDSFLHIFFLSSFLSVGIPPSRLPHEFISFVRFSARFPPRVSRFPSPLVNRQTVQRLWPSLETGSFSRFFFPPGFVRTTPESPLDRPLFNTAPLLLSLPLLATAPFFPLKVSSLPLAAFPSMWILFPIDGKKNPIPPPSLPFFFSFPPRWLGRPPLFPLSSSNPLLFPPWGHGAAFHREIRHATRIIVFRGGGSF